MANDIDLWADLEEVVGYIETAKTKEDKNRWEMERRNIISQIKQLYPDMMWSETN